MKVLGNTPIYKWDNFMREFFSMQHLKENLASSELLNFLMN